ncbi:histidine phosphatase family protein [Rahnella woolbedingensis]|uniref:Histidine phosphatase family protein n=1 Tax=Rahnella woolbedingensis TaxID=1510574 RepID=A0A419N9J7_9GAMM|nr:histidine phosphatase family protein [Rahnella woolbedingensis]RJT44343.1 histidine phosphatase family protein [Rahnella woolbedingensis]
MKARTMGYLAGGLLALSLVSQTASARETLIFVRHGEKPTSNSGQLTCKGLNRALALPGVLLSRFGHPDFIFASGPKEQKPGDSLRPLSTIMPTAVRLNQAINIAYNADDADGVAKELQNDKYQNALIFVAWEHKNLDKIVKKIVKENGGDPNRVPEWPGSDFDSIFIVTLDKSAPTQKVSFKKEAENLNGVSETCPNAS